MPSRILARSTVLQCFFFSLYMGSSPVIRITMKDPRVFITIRYKSRLIISQPVFVCSGRKILLSVSMFDIMLENIVIIYRRIG